ncbi:helix-turn-helix domain-containing protein [Ornithinibacillus caprae]
MKLIGTNVYLSTLEIVCKVLDIDIQELIEVE